MSRHKWWLEDGRLRTSLATGSNPLAIVVVPDIDTYLLYVELGRKVWTQWR